MSEHASARWSTALGRDSQGVGGTTAWANSPPALTILACESPGQRRARARGRRAARRHGQWLAQADEPFEQGNATPGLRLRLREAGAQARAARAAPRSGRAAGRVQAHPLNAMGTTSSTWSLGATATRRADAAAACRKSLRSLRATTCPSSSTSSAIPSGFSSLTTRCFRRFDPSAPGASRRRKRRKSSCRRAARSLSWRRSRTRRGPPAR